MHRSSQTAPVQQSTTPATDVHLVPTAQQGHPDRSTAIRATTVETMSWTLLPVRDRIDCCFGGGGGGSDEDGDSEDDDKVCNSHGDDDKDAFYEENKGKLFQY